MSGLRNFSSFRGGRRKKSPERASVLPIHDKYNEDNHDPFDEIIGAEIEISAAASGVVPDDSFTVNQAVNALGFGKFQVILSFVIGLCWMADSMEIMILSILSPALHCEWGVSQYRQAFLTTVVFVGMMFSSAFWGQVSDKYGRRRALLLSGNKYNSNKSVSKAEIPRLLIIRA